MNMPRARFFGLTILAGFFVVFSPSARAVSVAGQTQAWHDPLNVWQVIQELGTSLSGTVQSFTFRASTAASNINQFDYTALNTRIFDKNNNNSYIYGCIPPGSNPADRLEGLTFTTSGVPAGFQDVTIDFSCRNYNFVPGHRYLIHITNANAAAWGGARMRLAAAAYSNTSNDYFTGGGLRYAFDNGSCNAASYVWNSSTANYGCNVFTGAKDDLYFVLSNTAPPPRLPVIFIPGIGGSEFKATQDIVWSAADGHGGTYSHAYSSNEKIWVNQDEAASLGNDDYFDVLRLKTDGVTPEADLSLTGNLTSFGYPDIDSFFEDMGYSKGTNYFVFPYDWRKDIRSTKDSLDSLIETAKTASGQSKVNLVVHSMGGLVARYYISDSGKATKVNKLIELGVPHLGSVDTVKSLIYGVDMKSKVFGILPLGIPASEVKDVSQNMASIFQMLPSSQYFSFYNNSEEGLPFPFYDDRDIDNNQLTGPLNFNQTKTLLSNLGHNMTAFSFGEAYHMLIDSILDQTNSVKIYEIVGVAQPTLGQIRESWWITWPVNLFARKDEIFINGDNTVPLYSAALINETLNISGATDIYYVDQNHGELVKPDGTAMQTVKAILNDDNSLPVEVKDEKIVLEGEQISLDDGELDLYDEKNRHCGLNNNGEMEENIPEVFCTTSGNTKHAFVKKKAAKIKVKTTRKNPNSSKTTNIKKRTYREDKISKTAVYKDINIPQIGKVEFDLDPAVDTSPYLTLYPDSSNSNNTTTINPTSEVSGSSATDQTPPVTSTQISGAQNSGGVYTDTVTVTLTGNDTGSGILNTRYSLDNGQTVQTYADPIIVSSPGETTIQFTSTDNTGNQEIPQTITIQIAASPTPTPSPTASSGNTTSDSNTSTALNANTPGVSSAVTLSTPGVNVTANTSSQTSPTSLTTLNTQSASVPTSSSPDVLGITFENPGHISDQINVGGLLDQQQKLVTGKNSGYSAKEILGGLLVISGGIVTLASFGLLATFIKPIPK